MFILTVSENILSFVCGVGLLQGVLLSLLLYYHPKSDRSVNKFLSLYLLGITIVMAGPLTINLITWQKSFFFEPFPLAVSPLMYLYIRSFKQTITWKKALPHLLLFFIHFPISYFRVADLAGRYPDSPDIPEEAFRGPASLFMFGTRYVALFLYYFLSRYELNKYQKTIRHMFSETSQIDLKWAKWLINGYLLVVISSVIIYVLMTKFTDKFYLLYLINIAIATPYIYIVTYKGITQPTIWQKASQNNKTTMEEKIHESEEIEKVSSNRIKNQKQKMSDTRIEEIVIRITSLMEKNKLFSETELTLQDLSDKLQYPSHQVSLAINEGMNKNFYDLVNGYRVEEAKRKLRDPRNENYTILSVGFDAGFNSKTTFNTVFKKFTGLTPTDFREREKAREAYA